jgi:hypothetical protein
MLRRSRLPGPNFHFRQLYRLADMDLNHDLGGLLKFRSLLILKGRLGRQKPKI